jgi:hypothetical protein
MYSTWSLILLFFVSRVSVYGMNMKHACIVICCIWCASVLPFHCAGLHYDHMSLAFSRCLCAWCVFHKGFMHSIILGCWCSRHDH